jgi:hypothetical protein
MSASQCRCLGPTGNGGVGRPSRCAADTPQEGVVGRRAAIGLLGALIVLGAGLLLPGRSRAQEAPAKAEAPKESEPAQVQDSVEPLSARYRFIETYGVEENPDKPELIVQFEVGSLETVKQEIEKAQGAPDRFLGTIQAIYTERPAKVTKLGEVTDLVRRYDEFRPGGDFHAKSATPPLVKGLSIWCRFQRGGVPEIISLTDQRPLRQEEFSVITEKVFLPQLSSILPPIPSRVGDAWKIKPRASQSLLGSSVPDDGDFDVEGTLVDVRKAANGNTLTARIEISGKLTIDKAPAGVKAWIFFVFEPPPAPPALEPAAKPKAAEKTGIIEARGHIARVLMTRRLSIPIDDNGRLSRIVTKELNLVRRPASNPLIIPEVPIATAANSWVRYDDPGKRFHFNHPQALQLVSDTSENPDLLELVDKRATGTDALIFNIQREEVDPARNRQLLDPNFHIRNMRATWQKTQQDVVEGEAGWLPNDASTPAKRRVHRFEAALKNGPSAPRTYCNQYLLLDSKGSIVVTAITERNDQLVFRSQVEDVIKSFEFDQGPGAGVPPSRPSASAAPASAAPASAAPAVRQGRPR